MTTNAQVLLAHGVDELSAASAAKRLKIVTRLVLSASEALRTWLTLLSGSDSFFAAEAVRDFEELAKFKKFVSVSRQTLTHGRTLSQGNAATFALWLMSGFCRAGIARLIICLRKSALGR